MSDLAERSVMSDLAERSHDNEYHAPDDYPKSKRAEVQVIAP